MGSADSGDVFVRLGIAQVGDGSDEQDFSQGIVAVPSTRSVDAVEDEQSVIGGMLNLRLTIPTLENGKLCSPSFY